MSKYFVYSYNMNVNEYFNDRNSAIQFMEEIIDEINEVSCKKSPKKPKRETARKQSLSNSFYRNYCLYFIGRDSCSIAIFKIIL